LKEKVDAILAKGAKPDVGKWNNHDIKVMIQWFKRDGDKSMPKNKVMIFIEQDLMTKGDKSDFNHF
jgi:hypothetical protein